MKTTLLALIALLLIAAPAMAEPPQYRHWTVNAPAMCHPALLRFDSDVRKRPLAVVNEGTSAAFVTCSLPIDMANENGIESFYAVLRNMTGSPQTAKCTGVYGVDDGEAIYVTRHATVQPGQRHRLELEAEDFGLERLHSRVGISCLLPAMVGVNEVGTEEKL
jgi:hypothetical protein